MTTSSTTDAATFTSSTQFMVVPTKTGDANTNTAVKDMITQSAKKIKQTDIKKETDPFLFYSIRENKMAYLMHLDDEDENKDVIQAENQGQYNISNQNHDQAAVAEVVPAEVRKSRVSFELHPYLVMESFLNELMGKDE